MIATIQVFFFQSEIAPKLLDGPVNTADMPTTISAEKTGTETAATRMRKQATCLRDYKLIQASGLCLVQRQLSESRQANHKFRMAVLFALLETSSKPPEGSIVEIEPALTERSRIHPFAA